MGTRRKVATPEDLKSVLRLNWTVPRDPFNEVYDGIYIGDATTALSLGILRWEGINHVLNGALACASCLRKEICGGCVLTREAFYRSDGIAFKGIQANDERRFPLYLYFEDAAEFIDEALKTGASFLHFCTARYTATNVDLLRRLGVTHILNAAVGTDWIRYVDTSPEYYTQRKFTCEFYGIPAMDIMNYQLHPFFDASNEFIESALEKNGKVLVHCREGISRSATLVIAFLMMKRNMSASEAVKLVRSKRQVFPNDGFLQQLCDLDIRLNKA